MIASRLDLDDDAWDEAHRQARVSGIVTWTSTGVLLAGILPGIPMLLLAPEAPPLAAYVVGSLAIGALGGVVLGLIRPVERVSTWLISAERHHMVTPLGIIVGFVIGMIWGGLAGSTGGAMVGLAFALLEPGGGVDAGAVVLIAAIVGGPPGWTLGGVGIAIAGTVRSVQVTTGAPWWLPAVAAGAGAVGFFGWTLGLLMVLGFVLENLPW